MSPERATNAFDLLGQGEKSFAALRRAGEPKLEISWGSFHPGLAGNFWFLIAGARAKKKFLGKTIFKDCWIEGRVPRRALLAAALWHMVFVLLPLSQFFAMPPRNPGFENTEITWSGAINDLPLLEIPGKKAKPSPRGQPAKPLPPQGADAFHPRQRIFTDPVHPTHTRQTLINPAAPPEAPKILPPLPNIVQLQQTAGPARPRIQISEQALAKLRPRKTREAAVTAAVLPDAPNLEQRPAEMNLTPSPNAPAKPQLQLDAGAAPRVAQHAQSGDVEPAPDVGTQQTSAAGGNTPTLIALSATPAPPAAEVQVPQGNLSSRLAISPEGKQPGVPGGSPSSAPSSTGGAVGGAGSNGGTGMGSDAGNHPVGVSISGGNPPPASGVSGLGGAAKISAPKPHVSFTRPDPKAKLDDPPERSGPPNFAALPPGARPEQIFASKHVYTINVNMPNLNSATGSWILHFSELHKSPDGSPANPRDLSRPIPLRKVDPKYPPHLIKEHVEGEIVLYAVIRRDGSVESIQLVHGVDEELNANAMNALSQWKFQPAARQGSPVDLEAIVHIPFHAPAIP